MDVRAGSGGRPGRPAREGSRPGRPAREGSRPDDGGGRTVAAFDFDGTLTRLDSLLQFLVFARGASTTARAVIAEGPRFALVLLGRSSRDEVKEALLTRVLAGADARKLSRAGEAFAESLVRRGLRRGVRDRLDWHRRAGHQVVIVSASPTLYLDAAGSRLGVDAVLATELEVDADQRLTGKLMGRNCRGAEKVRRLRAWLESSTPAPGSGAERPTLLWAYGDSGGDAGMLAMADVPVWVGWRRRLPGHPSRGR